MDPFSVFPERLWDPELYRLITVGLAPVRTLLTLQDSVWASCANQVTVIQGASLTTQVGQLSGPLAKSPARYGKER